MQAPKRKTSKSKRDMRRSHHSISAISLDTCPSCGEKKMRHQLCPACGDYRGRSIVTVSED